MNTEIENIIRDNDYTQLNTKQLAAVSEWASSEEEYATMRQIIASAPLLNEGIAPSPKLKTSLMETFAAAHAVTPTAAASNSRSNRKVIFLWMRGAAAIAAILLVVFMVYPLFNSNSTNDLVADNKNLTKSEKQKSPEATENEASNNMDETLTEPVAATETEIEGVVEAPNRIAIAERTAPAERVLNVFTNPGISLTAPSEDFTFAGSTSPSVTLSAESSVSGSLLNFTTGASGAVFTATHSDRIAMADLPERSRQVIHERPEILDLLHTAF